MKILIKSTLLVPKRFQAITYGFIICVRPEFADDKGLIAHEQVHVKQFWNNPILFPLRYLFSKSYRLQYEVEAYREQLKYYSDDRTWKFAGLLAANYNLGISIDEAFDAISRLNNEK